MCQEIAAEADAVLAQATHALTAIQRYEGCQPLIQKVHTKTRLLYHTSQRRVTDPLHSFAVDSRSERCSADVAGAGGADAQRAPRPVVLRDLAGRRYVSDQCVAAACDPKAPFACLTQPTASCRTRRARVLGAHPALEPERWVTTEQATIEGSASDRRT